MYSVLAVDDDRTCLLILKACLEKWNYQVTTVKHAHEALSMLRNKSFDLVVTDVHMPDMNGLELQKHINQEFRLPVILISADTRAKVMCMGVRNGAQRFFVKPVVADDLKDIWQFAEWWKRTKNNNTPPLTQINGICQQSVTMVNSHNGNENNNAPVPDVSFSATENASLDNTTGRRSKRLAWTSDLHNRFVEAILVIGYHRAVPTNILEVMNVEGLTRGQVASHLQKYEKFLQRVLDGRRNIEFSSWTDLNYYSGFVSGNPTLVLLNQLRDEQRKGKLAVHNPLRPSRQESINLENLIINARAPNGSMSSFRPLPPFTIAEGSSSRNATLMPNNVSDSSVNVASWGLESATLSNAHNENMGSIVGSSTSNYTQNLGYWTNQMDYCNQNTLAQEQDNYSRNGGLNRGAKNDMLSSANHVTPSSFAHFWKNFHSQQSMDVGGQDNNNFYHGNNLNTDQLTQLGNNHGNPSIGISSGANHFGNTSAMNAHQLGGEQMADGSWFNSIRREDGKDKDYNPDREL